MKYYPFYMFFVFFLFSQKVNACAKDTPYPNVFLEMRDFQPKHCIDLNLIYPKKAGKYEQLDDVFVSAKSKFKDDYVVEYQLKVKELNSEQLFSHICLSETALESTEVKVYYTDTIDEHGVRGITFCGISNEIRNLAKLLEASKDVSGISDTNEK